MRKTFRIYTTAVVDQQHPEDSESAVCSMNYGGHKRYHGSHNNIRMVVHISCKPRVVMMWTLSSKAAPQVVTMTTCCATSDDKIGIMTTLSYRNLYCPHLSAYVPVLWWSTQMLHVALSVVPIINKSNNVGKEAISKTYARKPPQRTFTRTSMHQDNIIELVLFVRDKLSANW